MFSIKIIGATGLKGVSHDSYVKINYKDMLKDGKGTDFVIIDISFDTYIRKVYFSKNMLKK